jgi:hypothetical protein
MGTWLGRMLGTAGWLFFLAGPVAAASPSAAQLAGWVRALDANDFSAREAASRQLVAAGEEAIGALADGVASSSPEAAWRASLALEQVALGGSDATLQRVAAALRRLSQSGKPGLAAMTKELYAKQAMLRRDRAMSKVRSLGGKFAGDEEQGSPLEVGLVLGGVVPRLIIQPEEEAILGIEIPDEPPAVEELLKVADAPAAVSPPAEEIVGPSPPPDDPPPLVEAREALDAAIAEAFVGEVIEVAVEPSPSDEEVSSESLILDKSWRGGDAGVASLREVPRLVSLSIDHAPLTDEALDHIAALADLAELDVRGTAFTSAGLHKFRERRPTTRVYAIGTAMLGVNAQHRGKCELTGVYQGSGAFEAGLKPADEIVAVEGRKIRDFGDLTIAVYARGPGDKLKVEFRRGGQAQTAEVTLKERKELERVR